MTAATNLVLAVACFLCAARLSSAGDARTRMWRRFLLSLGVAALAGVVKHGLAEYAASSWHQNITLLCHLSAGVSGYYAQRATLESPLFGADSRRVLLTLVRVQLTIFALLAVLTPGFRVVLLHTGLGLVGVCVAEWTAYRRGLVTTRWHLAGVATALLPGAVYVIRWPSYAWFNHIDLAHVLLVASCVLIARGSRTVSRRAAAMVTCSIIVVTAAAQLSAQEPLSLADQCAGRPAEPPAVITAALRAISLKDDRAASRALDAIEVPAHAAAAAAPFDVGAQYDLAVVLGARSDREGGRRKVAAAVQLQAQAQRVIALAPDHPGAHYLLARLYAAVRRLDRLTRFLASRMLGGDALLNPPWPQIQKLFEVAERGDPCEPEYHYELAVLHREQHAFAQANTELRHVLELTGRNDGRWTNMRRQAETWLAAGKRPPQF